LIYIRQKLVHQNLCLYTSNCSKRNKSLYLLEACFLAGDKELVEKVSAAVRKDLQQQINFYNSLSGIKADNMAQEKQTAESYLQALGQMQTMYNPSVAIPGKVMLKDSVN
jgi:hypothetical protein